MEMTRLLIFTLIIFSSCNSKQSPNKQPVKEDIPNQLIQVWDQSKCDVCDDPWREWSEKIDDYTNLVSEKDEYGDKTMTAESYVLFKNVPLIYTEGYKRNASFRISYRYYSKNCWSNEWRDASLSLGTPGYWSKKNVEWIKNVKNGDLFDVLMFKPEFEQRNPEHACDYTSFSVKPANYDKIVVFPAGELNIKKTGDYKFKGNQGEFELLSESSMEDDLISFDGGELGAYFTDEEFYIIAVDISSSDSDAGNKVDQLKNQGYRSDYLWIPDFKSLSGAEYFSVFIGPFNSLEECAITVESYRKSNPSAYGLLVSNESSKRVEIRGPGRITRK